MQDCVLRSMGARIGWLALGLVFGASRTDQPETSWGGAADCDLLGDFRDKVEFLSVG